MLLGMLLGLIVSHAMHPAGKMLCESVGKCLVHLLLALDLVSVELSVVRLIQRALVAPVEERTD